MKTTTSTLVRLHMKDPISTLSAVCITHENQFAGDPRNLPNLNDEACYRLMGLHYLQLSRQHQ